MLADRIKSAIVANGPMRLDRFIGICLYDPTDGYYATRTVFGADGDFTTAPEISQIFGETIGVWVLSAWLNMGTPDEFALIELGAGRGTLMADALRVTNRDPRFSAGAKISILENSPRRRAEQIKTIPTPNTHLDHLRELPPIPTIFIANEFFDALPIRQFRNEGGGWLEAHIDANLAKIWRPIAAPPAALAPYVDANTVVEWNEGSVNFANQIAAHINNHGGAFLAIDYGDWDGTGETLQAIKQHEFTDPLADPGHADITAHVRFADVADGFSATPTFASQGAFLDAFGGVTRRDQLMAANPTLAETIRAGYDRLSAPEQMGELFKVLAIEGK